MARNEREDMLSAEARHHAQRRAISQAARMFVPTVKVEVSGHGSRITFTVEGERAQDTNIIAELIQVAQK